MYCKIKKYRSSPT